MIWKFIGAIFAFGAIGGIVNALISDNGFIWPREVKGTKGDKIIKPGFVGNAIVGGVASFVSWSLYGPLAELPILGGMPDTEPLPGIPLSSIGGAILVGIGGSRWLTNEVDKKILKKTAVEAAKASANPVLAKQISNSASPEAGLIEAAKANTP